MARIVMVRIVMARIVMARIVDREGQVGREGTG